MKYQLTSEEAGDSGRERRPEPTERGDADHERGGTRAGRSAARARRADPRAQRVSDGERDSRRAKPSTTRRRESAAGRRRRGSTTSASTSLGWLMTWTSMPTPESAITRLITEPRSSSPPARPPGRPHDDLCRIERAGGLDQRLADVGADGLPVLAAQLFDAARAGVEQLLGRRRGQTVLRTHVDGDEFTVRALCHPRRPPDHPIAARSPRSAPRPRAPSSPRGSRCRGARGTRGAPSSTRSATHRSASSRSAVRFPGRK